ncbi:MAG: caspase family protein, partial [Hyphomicrobium sp.]
LVVVDACRNEPYARCKTKGAGDDGTGLAFRDLGRVDPGHSEPLIVSSTRPGGRAIDGKAGQMSPFAKAFTTRLSAHPERLYLRLINEVAEDVSQATGGYQRPQIVSSGAPAMCLKGRDCGWEK